MGDKSWIYGYDPEIATMGEPTITNSKKGAAGSEFSRERTHCFCSVKGIVHREFVPHNTTINS
jgi:hypothetical protein